MSLKIAYQISLESRRQEETAAFAQADVQEEYSPQDAAAVSHVLCFTEHGLALRENRRNAPGPTCVDFSDPALQHRRRTSGRKQGLARAVGLMKMTAPRVLDATAGLGRDAYILATLGCEVTMLERSALVHALLADGLRRGQAYGDADLRETLGRMKLFHEDARHRLEAIRQGAEEKPDVIYLDPMFPPRRKSARVKKDMANLQQVLGPEEDFPGLLALARQCARQRVVVKRPGGKDSGDVPACSFQVTGKSSHFDVYLVPPEHAQG